MAVVEGPPCPGGAGSGGLGVANLSASGGRCDVGRAEAACAVMGWSVAAGTEVWAKAVGIAPGWLAMWTAPGPAGVGVDGGTGPSVAAAEGSWDCCVGPVTLRGPDVAAAAGASSDGWPVGAEPETMKVGGHFDWAEGPEVAAEDLLHLALCRPLAGQPWHSAAASGGGAGAGASAGVQLWPVAGPLTPGNPALAGLGDHQAAEGQEADLQVVPVPL